MMTKNELEDAGSCGLGGVQGSVVYLRGGTGSVDVLAQIDVCSTHVRNVTA
jgi:hypothetical protein